MKSIIFLTILYQEGKIVYLAFGQTIGSIEARLAALMDPTSLVSNIGTIFSQV
jgi:hypothetical protein